MFKQLNNGVREAISVYYKTFVLCEKKARLTLQFTDQTPYNRKFSFLASLLDEHVSPRILAAEVRRT